MVTLVCPSWPTFFWSSSSSASHEAITSALLLKLLTRSGLCRRCSDNSSSLSPGQHRLAWRARILCLLKRVTSITFAHPKDAQQERSPPGHRPRSRLQWPTLEQQQQADSLSKQSVYVTTAAGERAVTFGRRPSRKWCWFTLRRELVGRCSLSYGNNINTGKAIRNISDEELVPVGKQTFSSARKSLLHFAHSKSEIHFRCTKPPLYKKLYFHY